MKATLSPRQLAYAIGVSESSLKRWVDSGVIRASRTSGGHRRIASPEAVRFIRRNRAPLLHPEALGLPEVGAAQAGAAADGSDADRLFAYLREGRAAEVRGLLMSRYLEGRGLAEIFDGVVGEAMHRLGELWKHDAAGIILEHRATDICMQAVQLLRATLESEFGAPVAVGGGPPGDPYLLPSLLAGTVLAGEGYNAMNLGPETPPEALIQAAEKFEAELVWLSISVARRPEELKQMAAKLAGALGARGIRLVVGGRQCDALSLPVDENMLVGSSMAELAAFGKGLRAGTKTEELN